MRCTGLLFIAVLVACNNGGSTQARPVPERGVATAVGSVSAAAPSDSEGSTALSGPVHFVWTDFHFELAGTGVMEVNGRKVRELFSDARTSTDKGEPSTEVFFRLASYELTGKEAESLHSALREPAFWSLDGPYIDRDIQDGTTQTFTVSFASKKKDVYCYQSYPPPAKAVQTVIRRIHDSHKRERKAAPVADAKTAATMAAEAQKLGMAAGRRAAAP